jgi:hypothetical protein
MLPGSMNYTTTKDYTFFTLDPKTLTSSEEKLEAV